MSKITFFKLPHVQMIPSDWIASIQGKRFSEEDFRNHMVRRAEDESNLLFGIRREETLIGFIWAEYNSLEDTVFVNTVVIDDGFAKAHSSESTKTLKEAIKFLKELVLHLRVKGIVICSSHDKIMVREGCSAHPEKMWFYRNPHKEVCPCKQMKIWGREDA